MSLSFVRLGRLLPQMHACLEKRGLDFEDLSLSEWQPPQGPQTYFAYSHVSQELMITLGRSNTEVFDVVFQISMAYLTPEKPKAIGTRSKSRGYDDPLLKLTEKFEEVAREMDRLMTNDDRYRWLPSSVLIDATAGFNLAVKIRQSIADAVRGNDHARGYKDALDTLVDWMGRDFANQILFAIHDDMAEAGVPALPEAKHLWERYQAAVRKRRMVAAVSTVSDNSKCKS